MAKFTELNERNSTIFTWVGQEIAGKPMMLATIHDPHPSDWNTDGNPTHYEAVALNVFDEEYKVIWEVIDPEITDESEICDWDNPIEVKAV